MNTAEYCVLSECKSRGIYFGLEENKYVVPAGPNSVDSFPGGDTQTWIVVLTDGTMLYAYQSLYHNYVIVKIMVDINGNKGPNKMGKYYNCNKTSYAFTCGALIQYDGWKIPKDYPW